MELFEIEESSRQRREAAADRLREIADQLSRHNALRFRRDGVPYTVKVPDEVEFSVEIEIGDDNELEIEIRW